MFPLVVGWVGLGQLADGLSWVGSYKVDPWTTLSYITCLQLSVVETPVMFAGNDSLWHAFIMSSPYSELQPHPEPSLITAHQFGQSQHKYSFDAKNI